MLRAAWRRLTLASPRAVLAAAWLAAVVYGFPGRLPRASVLLLQHARAPHPTVFSLLWHVLEYAVAGPTGMLLAQLTLAIAGAYGILRAALPERRAAWLTAALAVCPPVLATLTVVSPAALATALLLAGAGTRGTRLSLAALGLAAAVHPAAIVAVLPVLLLRNPPVRALVAWLAIAAFAIAAATALTRKAPAVHAPRIALLAGASTMDPPTAPDDVLLRLGVPTERSHVQDGVTAVLDVLPVVYAPWLYLAAALALLVVMRRDRTAVLLLAAGLAFEAALLVTAPDRDLYHSVGLFALTLLVALRGRRP